MLPAGSTKSLGVVALSLVILTLALETKKPNPALRLDQLLQAATQIRHEDLQSSPELIRQLSVDLNSALSEILSQPDSEASAFSSLEACALQSTYTFSLRALCAENAKRLAVANPKSFQKSFEELEPKLSPELRNWAAQH